MDVLKSVDLDETVVGDVSLETSWMCPVCGKEYDTLESIEVDGLVEEIIAETPPDVSSVILTRNGDWKVGEASGEMNKRKSDEFAQVMKLLVAQTSRKKESCIELDDGSSPSVGTRSPPAAKKPRLLHLAEHHEEQIIELD